MTFWNRKPEEDLSKKKPLNPRDLGMITHHEANNAKNLEGEESD